MSGLWMLLRQTGPDPEDLIFTTNVEGLDRLRREARFNTIMMCAVIVLAVFLTGLMAGSTKEPVWAFIGGFLLIVIAVGSALLAGGTYGYYRAFRDLSEADVKMTVMEMDDEDE